MNRGVWEEEGGGLHGVERNSRTRDAGLVQQGSCSRTATGFASMTAAQHGKGRRALMSANAFSAADMPAASTETEHEDWLTTDVVVEVAPVLTLVLLLPGEKVVPPRRVERDRRCAAAGSALEAASRATRAPERCILHGGERGERGVRGRVRAACAQRKKCAV